MMPSTSTTGMRAGSREARKRITRTPGSAQARGPR